MKTSEIFSGNYLKAADLQGRTISVTISQVEMAEFDDGNKLVIHFRGKEKLLVCNKTNAAFISETLGSDETDDWIGQNITLTVTKVPFGGKLVPAIRVVPTQRAVPVQAPAPKAPTEPSDDVPF